MADPNHVWTRPWRRLQNQVLADARLADSPCYRCGGPIDYSLPGNVPTGPTVDHLEPMIQGGEQIVDPSLLAVSHMSCNSRHGALVGNLARGRQLHEGPHLEVSQLPMWDPSQYEGDGGIFVAVGGEMPPVWSSCEWISALAEELNNFATWPRLMSHPHPRAVGTYGPAIVAIMEDRRRNDPLTPERAKTLRWWQKLVIYRMYEHDQAGELVWRKVLVSTSRQVGKSVCLREIALHRMADHQRYGEPQLVLHVAKDLGIADEIQRPARQWANMVGTPWHGVGGNGRWAVEFQGVLGRWIVRSQQAVYGYSASLALIDEAWDIDPEHISEGIEPTMVEREQSQMLMVSTAHREATPLYPDLRMPAIDNLTNPSDDVLLIEWSAPPNADEAHIAAHRMASPYWDHRRAHFINSKVGQEGFREQWLNIWPDMGGNKVLFAPRELIMAAINPGLKVTAGTESRTFAIYPAADQTQWHTVVAGISGDEILIQYVDSFPTAKAAIAHVAQEARTGVPSDLVIPRVLRGRIPRLAGVRTIVQASESDIAAATTIIRPLLLVGRVRHDGHEVLADHMARSALEVHGDTLRISSKESEGNVEAAKAAVLAGWWASRLDRPSAVVV